MLEVIKSLDQNLFLFLNAHHNLFFDRLMWLFSQKLFWTPLYVWFLWILYSKYPKHFWTILVAIVLMIVTSDQLCNLAKNGFMRLRPSQDPQLMAMVHIVNDYRGGMYGFYSGHAANTFAVAFFMIVLAAERRKYLVPIALLYAMLTAYSRIYLGVHYPGDVFAGVLAGIAVGIAFAQGLKLVQNRYFKLPPQ